MVKIRAHCKLHPEWFFRNWLKFEPTDYQIEIANSVRDNRLTTVASCNSAGKTGLSGAIVPWYLLTNDESIVVTTAPKWQQVKDLLWREVNTKWDKAATVYPLSAERPNVVSWQLASNWYAVGVASKDPSKIQGYHADSGNLLVIADEAAAIEQLLFEGVYALLTSELCRFLMMGNPTSQAGEFYDSFKPGSLFKKIRISAFDTPNFKANNITDEQSLTEAIQSKRTLEQPYPSLISPIWAYERLKKWGAGSPMYQSRIRATFPEFGENSLIPLNWIEQATTNERLDKILGLNLEDGDDNQEKTNDAIRKKALAEYQKGMPLFRGVDVARFGSDRTVITPRWGKIVGSQKTYFKEDTMQTAGRVLASLTNDDHDITNVDVIGIGAGVVDRLNEVKTERNAVNNAQFWHVQGINVAVPAKEKPKGKTVNDRQLQVLKDMEFANKRAELYWLLREMFETGEIYLMPDEKGHPPEDLMDELSSIEYKYLSGKIYIEEKQEMKKRLVGKSPDHADSLMLTLEELNMRWSLDDVISEHPLLEALAEDDPMRDPEPTGVRYGDDFDRATSINPHERY